MLLYISESTDPYFNIAAEEYFFKHFDEDFFMLYINEPSVIVGKHQNTIVETHKLYLKYGNIPRILKEYLARKGVIKSGNSHPPFKGDIVSILDQVISKTRSSGI